jgi:mannose-6-phosphate isomerase-like protein (cupin superfamily)
MDVEDIINKIEFARKNNSVCVFKQLFTKTPSWEQFINHLNYEYNKYDNKYDNLISSEKRDEIYKNGVVLYPEKDLFVSVRLSGMETSRFFPESNEVCIFFRKILNDNHATFNQIFLNFVEDEKNKVHMHSDRRETIFWLCQGSATFIVGDPDNWENIKKYELNAGDILFAAFGLPHYVESHSPRAAMVLAVNNIGYKRDEN